jgi:Spy/CpxP family protein refolding chaperone
MSLKNKFFSVLTLAVATIAFSTIGFGQDKTTPTTPVAPDKAVRPERPDRPGFGRHEHGGKEFGHRGGPGGMMMRGFRDLNLTDAQKDQIKAIHEANKPDESIMTELRTIHESRKAGTELTQEQKDRLKVIREQGRAKARSVHEQIMGVLTADQKAQLEKQREEMKQRMQEFRQKRELRQQTPRTPATPATTDKPKTIN